MAMECNAVDNRWLQQQIPACRPVFTAISASIGFIIIGLAFLVIGSIFTAFTANVSWQTGFIPDSIFIHVFLTTMLDLLLARVA